MVCVVIDLVGALGALGCESTIRRLPSAPPPRASAAMVAPLPQPSTPLPPAPEPAPTFVLRYACDDKYDADPECRPGKGAWDSWVSTLDLTAQTRSLLELEGGGPGGAEWNPSAPLVAFAASVEPGQARVELVGGPTFMPVARFKGYDVFFIPLAAWEAVERRPREGELPDDAPAGAIAVVELRVADARGALAQGLFAFGRGE